jgi:hypothetical protein
MSSAYPVTNEVLTERVRDLAAELGGWPSQRRVMRACRVGAPRADAVLARLRASGYAPTDSSTDVAATDVAATDVPASDVPAGGGTAPGTEEQAEAPGAEQGPDTRDEQPDDQPDEGPGEQVSPVADTPPDAPTDEAVTAPDGQTPTVPTATEPARGPVAAAAAEPPHAAVPVAVRMPRWPLWLIAAGAFVAIWGGWVGLGEMVGFGPIRLLPGIADSFVINSAITLPLGMEAYAAYALRVWLAGPAAGLTYRARRFAQWSALGALALGASGQIAYHLMAAAEITTAPWLITAFVSCLPVIVLGCGAALAHLTHQTREESA